VASRARRDLTERLANVALFSQCTKRERATVARHMETASLSGGTTLIEEGEEGDALFLVLEGSVSVRKGDQLVAEQLAGAYFGELALLDGEPRSATVVANEDVTVAVLGVRMFRTLLREFPEMALQLLAGLAGDVRRARDELDATHSSPTLKR
jgi:CRP/FNR family transcriptional regulator, cyclic AMP receptor protein